jgi:asparagine synthase (glutamine-hydrolysing)
MIGEIEYRGPDSSGIFISRDKKAGLGVRRLSIIDLATGEQPIKNEDGSVTVVFNGEIYNYKELRKKLVLQGHRFKTKSDTEVLVHLYEKYGEEMPKYLNGMFAFAIWDENKNKLFIARDRVGIKPLYFYRSGSKLIFGSEVKAILKYKNFQRKLNLDALSFYCYLGYVPGRETMFENIVKLSPGQSISFSKSGLKVNKYFELSAKKDVDDISLDKLLENSVSMQLVSDVPVGVLLSGGLDSSLISYYISKIKKLKSFSIGFKEERYDESKYAFEVAKKLGTEHYNESFDVQDTIDIFNEIIPKLDEPFADPSILPTYKVSKLARKYVKVVLSGDGGDELFGGYPNYQGHILADLLRLLPQEMLDWSISLIDLIPNPFKHYDKKEVYTSFVKGIKKKPVDRHLFWMSMTPLGQNMIFNKPDIKSIEGLMPELFSENHNTRRMQILDFCTYLRDDLLFKVDRASMYNSLEVRVPYLDNRIIDYAFSTKNPHLSLFQTKILLRKLLKDKLPEVTKRQKRGFGLPMASWMRSELKNLVADSLDNKDLYNLLGKEKILKIWDEHLNQGRNNEKTLWMLVMLSGWLKNWF